LADRQPIRAGDAPPAGKPALFVTRFAPSPTGRLHRGNAFSALTAFAAARRNGGRFLLRLEDIDTARCRPEYSEAALEDLAWLGLTWEEPVRRQSQHRSDYENALDRLAQAGLLYRCFHTRSELAARAQSAPHGPQEPFTGGPLAASEEASRLAAGKAFAWRLSLDAARRQLGDLDGLTFLETGAGPRGETGRCVARPDLSGDIVLARKDVGVAYHLAVVVDDALQGVTQVIRGNDLFEATHIQRLLQVLLGLPAPAYHHHPLLAGPDGKRYAKRDRSETLAEIRKSGVSAADLRRQLGFASLDLIE
jgi:glutamyl-Q tRNA(Asp) synthetase